MKGNVKLLGLLTDTGGGNALNVQRTVKDLIAKFAEEDELEATLQELDEARAIATNALEREAALRIQIDLKAGIYGCHIIVHLP